MPKCIFCGKEVNYIEKFPYGEFPLCPRDTCRNRVVLQVSFDNFPVVWLGRDDLHNESDDEDCRRMSKEEYDAMESEEIIDIAADTSEALGDYFWEQYDTAVREALTWRRERIERNRIKDTPDNELPLLMDTIKFPANKVIFENRLRGIKEN